MHLLRMNQLKEWVRRAGWWGRSNWTRKNSSLTLASTGLLLHLTKSWLAGKIFNLLNIFFHPNTSCLLPDRLCLSVKILHKARHWGRILILKVFWEMSLWLNCNWRELAKGWEKWERKKEKKGERRGDCCLCVQRNCVTQSPQSQSQMISSNPVISHNPKFNQALTQYPTASSILKFKEHKFGSMKPKDVTSDFITQFIFFTYQNNNLNGKLQEIVYMYIHR